MSDVTFKKLPGVLSFQRGFVISDALFFDVFDDGSERAIKVLRHGIRGTQNVIGKEPKDVNNIQVTESAKTSSKASKLKISFGMRVLPLKDTLFSCAGTGAQDIRLAVEEFNSRAIDSDGLLEVAIRYARNILNGRWLWRNRVLGSAISITVSGKDFDEIISNALDTPMNNFNTFSSQEKKLGMILARGMKGEKQVSFTVSAEIDLGFKGDTEVFPSQNYVEQKPSGFARSLYKVGHPDPARSREKDPLLFNDIRIMGQAAIRDQKVGNALRTIDTWYPEYSEYNKPIPVEPQGANLDAQMFFRTSSVDGKKTSSFEILKRVNQVDPSSPDGMFLIASLMRGGVYSESDKAEKAAKKAETEAGE